VKCAIESLHFSPNLPAAPLFSGATFMQFKSLQAWLGWLEQCHPKEIDLGLDRIASVAERLNLTAPRARVITVAGTNGKGSCVAATAALLRAAGLSIGVYTSPHLLRYNERIAINNTFASDDEICSAFTAIAKTCDDTSLTYFEYATLAALIIFQHHNVDVMVLEVGLGGRLDAVNLLAPDVAVITSIDLDHQDWLGDNREAIGAEKAGIMRESKPVICADSAPPTSVLAAAEKLAAPFYAINQSFGYSASSTHWNWWVRGLDNTELRSASMSLPHLPLPSLAAAIQAVALLEINPLTLDVGKIFGQLQLPGRFQLVRYGAYEVILDVAHNPAASAYLAARLRATKRNGRTVAMVAMMADKDRRESLRNLAGEIDSWYLVDLPHIARAATIEQMREDLASLQLEPDGAGTVAECLKQLSVSETQPERIVIWGSFYTVAAALAVFELQSQDGGEA
jgi:dihydrofolate synthase/folylpolyglutamate synthase